MSQENGLGKLAVLLHLLQSHRVTVKYLNNNTWDKTQQRVMGKGFFVQYIKYSQGCWKLIGNQIHSENKSNKISYLLDSDWKSPTLQGLPCATKDPLSSGLRSALACQPHAGFPPSQEMKPVRPTMQECLI